MRKRERESVKKGRERLRKREREKERECVKKGRERLRKREREKEREEEREKKRQICRIVSVIFKRNDKCLGTF